MARQTLDSRLRRRVRSDNRPRFGCLNSESFAIRCQLGNVRTRPEIPKGSLGAGSEATRSGAAIAVELSSDRYDGGGWPSPLAGRPRQGSGDASELLRRCFRALLPHVDRKTLDLLLQG